MLAALGLASLGLEADGRRAHIIPFKNNKKGIVEAQLIIDYKGLSELVRRSGEVSDLHADVVCENDDFDFSFGTGSHLKHKPSLKSRGEVIAAYSYVRLKDGSDSFEVLGLEDILKVRDGSQGYKSAVQYNKPHPWIEHFSEMAKKTAFRRHSKWLPLSPELHEKINIDDEEVKPVNVTPTEALKPEWTKEEVKPALEEHPLINKEAGNVEHAENETVPLVLDPEPPKGAELLRIKCGEYGMTQSQIIKLLQDQKFCGRTAKTFDDLTDEKVDWLITNFDGVVSGKAFEQ
jgi:recombination protein RecT